MARAPPCSKTGHGLLHASKPYVPIEFNVDLCCLRNIFKTVLSSGYILILLSIEYILASLFEMCQGWSRMRNVK